MGVQLTLGCEEKNWVFLVAYAGMEFWLGKTKRLKAASLIELVIMGLLLGAAFLGMRGKHADQGINGTG